MEAVGYQPGKGRVSASYHPGRGPGKRGPGAVEEKAQSVCMDMRGRRERMRE